MKLDEIWGQSQADSPMSFFGFHLEQTEDREDDNVKLWHDVTLPNGQTQTLDHSPYEMIDQDTFRRYVLFFKEHKRFPNRHDVNSHGPLSNQDLIGLTR